MDVMYMVLIGIIILAIGLYKLNNSKSVNVHTLNMDDEGDQDKLEEMYPDLKIARQRFIPSPETWDEYKEKEKITDKEEHMNGYLFDKYIDTGYEVVKAPTLLENIQQVTGMVETLSDPKEFKRQGTLDHINIMRLRLDTISAQSRLISAEDIEKHDLELVIEDITNTNFTTDPFTLYGLMYGERALRMLLKKWNGDDIRYLMSHFIVFENGSMADNVSYTVDTIKNDETDDEPDAVDTIRDNESDITNKETSILDKQRELLSMDNA